MDMPIRSHAITRTLRLAVALLVCALTTAAQNNAPQPVKQMARNADPSFEVAVIKPSDPDDRPYAARLYGQTGRRPNKS